LREICLHILDIAANSVSAGAKKIVITIEENLNNDILKITVMDNGKGMDADMVKRVADPFTTSRTERRVGLGIPLFKFAAESSNGWFKIDSELGKGTSVTAQFQLSHIDRMPLGNVADTLLLLEMGTPEINWVFSVRRDDQEFYLDDADIKKELEGISITEPDVIRFMRNLFEEGISAVNLIN